MPETAPDRSYERHLRFDKVIDPRAASARDQFESFARSDHPSTLIGVPFDRPVVGYSGNTVNTLRLWSAVAADNFDLGRFSAGDFVGALAETLAAVESCTALEE